MITPDDVRSLVFSIKSHTHTHIRKIRSVNFNMAIHGYNRSLVSMMKIVSHISEWAYSIPEWNNMILAFFSKRDMDCNPT